MSDKKNPEAPIKTTIQVDPSKVIKVQTDILKKSLDPTPIRPIITK